MGRPASLSLAADSALKAAPPTATPPQAESPVSMTFNLFSFRISGEQICSTWSALILRQNSAEPILPSLRKSSANRTFAIGVRLPGRTLNMNNRPFSTVNSSRTRRRSASQRSASFDKLVKHLGLHVLHRDRLVLRFGHIILAKLSRMRSHMQLAIAVRSTLRRTRCIEIGWSPVSVILFLLS